MGTHAILLDIEKRTELNGKLWRALQEKCEPAARIFANPKIGGSIRRCKARKM
jgi:hypothetical protein